MIHDISWFYLLIFISVFNFVNWLHSTIGKKLFPTWNIDDYTISTFWDTTSGFLIAVLIFKLGWGK